MKLNRILAFLAIVILLPAVKGWAVDFGNEDLHYVISYKWGLIHKDAGEATLSLRNQGDLYKLTLTGKTKPWADKFFQVRDTLLASVAKNGFRPVSYTKIAHEDGKFRRDEISYRYAGSTVGGDVKRIKINKDGKRYDETKTLTATGRTFDMLSVFYFLRTIDYTALTSGNVVKATVFSGSKEETLTIRSAGVEEVKLRDKSKCRAYHIRFRFTTQGQKKSSDDIDAWISVEPPHIPLLVVGSLSVGQVKCQYLPPVSK